MTKIIDLPTTASTDANTFVPVYKNGKTQKVSATALGGGGSGLDLTSTTDVTTVDGTEYIPLNKPLGTVLRVTIQRILDWMLAKANTWTAAQTINANLNFSGSARRITGDFTSTPINNRTAFQTSSSNSITSIGCIPSGSGASSNFSAYASSDPANSSRAQLAVAGGVSVNLSSDITGSGTYLPLLVYASGVERMRVNTDGTVLISSNVFGYGTGTGGTVTQATSRATSVTLNKPSGSITMFTAAGTSTWGSFTVTNSVVSSTDTIILSVRGASNTYVVSTDNVTSGSFRIVFSAVAGTATDTPVINFNVIRGSNS